MVSFLHQVQTHILVVSHTCTHAQRQSLADTWKKNRFFLTNVFFCCGWLMSFGLNSRLFFLKWFTIFAFCWWCYCCSRFYCCCFYLQLHTLKSICVKTERIFLFYLLFISLLRIQYENSLRIIRDCEFSVVNFGFSSSFFEMNSSL